MGRGFLFQLRVILEPTRTYVHNWGAHIRENILIGAEGKMQKKRHKLEWNMTCITFVRTEPLEIEYRLKCNCVAPNDRVKVYERKYFYPPLCILHLARGLIQKCEVWIDSFRGVKYKLQPMQICTRVGPLTADFFANYDLWITICWQMGHSVTDMQEKRKTSCAPHKHAVGGGFQGGTRKI